jgi:hypothetical protein
MDHHALAVDIGELQVCEFGSSPGTIQRHQDGAMKRKGRALDQAGHFLLAQDNRQVDMSLGIGGFLPGSRIASAF